MLKVPQIFQESEKEEVLLHQSKNLVSENVNNIYNMLITVLIHTITLL